jgi:hypothetical protein
MEKINIDDLTLGQIKEINSILGTTLSNEKSLNNDIIGRKCIVRTYSAGVWYGTILEKTSTECVVGNARRMYYWKNIDKGITLSNVAISGIHSNSKIQPPVEKVWLQQIELIPCTEEAIATFDRQPPYERE